MNPARLLCPVCGGLCVCVSLAMTLHPYALCPFALLLVQCRAWLHLPVPSGLASHSLVVLQAVQA